VGLHRKRVNWVLDADIRGFFDQMNHPYICALHDIGPNYLVMEYIKGETLEARINQETSLEDLNLSSCRSRLSSMAHIRPRFGN